MSGFVGSVTGTNGTYFRTNRPDPTVPTSLMIHEPWTIAVGGADELDKTAEQLRRVGKQIASVYSTRRGIPLGKIREWMGAETWWSADEAVEAGMADRVVEGAAVPSRGRVSPAAEDRFSEEKAKLAAILKDRSRQAAIAARARDRQITMARHMGGYGDDRAGYPLRRGRGGRPRLCREFERAAWQAAVADRPPPELPEEGAPRRYSPQ